MSPDLGPTAKMGRLAFGAAKNSRTAQHRPTRQRGTDEMTNHSDLPMSQYLREEPKTETNETTPPPFYFLHTHEAGGNCWPQLIHTQGRNTSTLKTFLGPKYG